MSTPEQEAQIREANSIHTTITYSGQGDASRLSLLAYDAACFVATEHKADLMVIAGEQSSRRDRTTTGEYLARLTPLDVSFDVVALRNDRNRLLNTSFQAIELARVMPSGPQVTITGWRFHEGRIEDNLAHNGANFLRTYVAADAIIEMLWNTAGLWDGDHAKKENAWAQRYGFEVDWPTVRDRGIQAFADRELGQTMQRLHRISPGGRGFRIASKLRRVGRLDDLDPEGNAIMKTTR